MAKRMTGSGQKPSRPMRGGAQSKGEGLDIEHPDLFDVLQVTPGDIPPSAHLLDRGLPSDRDDAAAADAATDAEAHKTPAPDTPAFVVAGSDQPETMNGCDPVPMPNPTSSEAAAEMPSRTSRKRGRPPGGRKPIPTAGPARAAPKPRADSPPAQERAFLSVQSVALRYDASVATIWRWPKTRGFPKPRKIGRLTRWALADLEAFDQAMSST